MKWSDPSRREQVLELVEFAVGGDVYAIPLEAVEEILPVRGEREEQEVRGERLTVSRAERVLGLSDGGNGTPTRGIVIRAGGRRFILAVERVVGVGPVERSTVQRTPAWFAGRTAALVRGVVERGEHLIVILEPSSLSQAVIREDETVLARDTDDG